MIHTARQSPKFTKLVRRLRSVISCDVIDHETIAIGLLERLWHVAITGAQRGDVGRFDNESLAEALGWYGEADKLIDLLVETGWLDPCDEHRLLVHGWEDHSPAFVKKNISRKGGFLSRAVLRPQDGSTEEENGDLSQFVPIPNQTKPNQTKPNQSHASSPRGYPDRFVVFWEAYPANAKGRKRGKKQCFELWKKIPAEDHDRVLAAAKNYAHEESTFVKDPERFLKADWWKSYLGKPSDTPSSRVATDEDLANWNPHEVAK